MATRYRLNQQQLAAELAKRRMSQNRWAQVLGIGRGHLSLLLNGKRPYPSAATRAKLLAGLQVPFSTLFEIEDVPLPGHDRPRHRAWLRRRSRRHGDRLMGELLQDLRFGVRALGQRPMLSVMLVLMLALGIGANTAMFSWLNGVLLDPLQVENPDRWVHLGMVAPSGFVSAYSHPTFRDTARLNDTFDGMYAYRTAPVSVSRSSGNERATASLVSGEFFDLLGQPALLGRAFSVAEDTVPGRDAVAVVSYGFWQRQLGADPAAAGSTVILNSRPFTIIGVMGPGFGFARLALAVDMWVPLSMQESVRPGAGIGRGHGYLQVRAVLPPGVTIEQASAAVNATHLALAADFPDDLEGTTVLLYPAKQSLVGGPDEFRSVAGVFSLLMAVVGLVLLIACANVAGLLLARAADRAREIGIRVALGAGRGRLLRQLLTESMLLSIVGAAAGIAVAVWANAAIMSLIPTLPTPVTLSIELDTTVLAFTSVIAVLTGIVFGLLPALRASRPDVVESLRLGDGRVAGGTRLRSAMVVTQVALSLVLLVASGLFVRSLQNATTIDPGFDPTGVLITTMDPALQGYADDEVQDFYRQLTDSVAALPAVRAVALAEMLPMSLGSQQWGATIEGYVAAADERTNFDYNFISPGYFETMGMSLVAGRDFTWQDTRAGDGAIIINETMAARFWPDENAVGRQINSGGMQRAVVGVVADAKYYSLGEAPLAYMYFPFLQSNQSALVLHVRSDGEPLALTTPVRQQIQALDPQLPMFDTRTLNAQMGIALLPARMTGALLALFGGLALLLAAIGLYGVMAYSVGQRTREIGIRMALGADRGTVLRMVLRHALVLTGIGAVLGLFGGAAIGRLAAGLLYGVSWIDPAAFGGALAAITLVMILASGLPARLATRVDPVDALRAE